MAKRAKTGGRQKGVPNKTTALLKDAILMAATAAGGEEGLVAYLTEQAVKRPAPFLVLLGKVLPTQTQQSDPIGPYDLTLATDQELEILETILTRLADIGAGRPATA